MAALLVHGSGGSRARVAAHARMLARHGYGVLALDLPGNGESDGHSNGLGDNAQPAITTALDYLAGAARRRPDGRAIGVSMGGEVLLEAAARDPRLRAVVSDGSARPEDADKALPPHGLERVVRGVMAPASRALAGTRAAPSLMPLMPRIAPRPVLLVAGGGVPAEIPTNRVYARAGGPTAQLWELHGVGPRRRRPPPPGRLRGAHDRLPRPRARASSRGARGRPRTARAARA